MIRPFSLNEIADAVGVSMADDQNASLKVNGVSTDTRSIEAGDLFVALSGEQFDGNKFVTQAAEKGAVAAVVSKSVDVSIPTIEVADTLHAYGQIAGLNRSLFEGKLVALTGSAGKTSCKQMIANVLSQAGNTWATRANYNNEVGVPLTLLEITAEHDFAVVEMGAGKAGDIGYLCQFGLPQVSLVTNVLAAHIEGFGSIETVAKTKCEIYDRLPADGCAVVNLDNSYTKAWFDENQPSNHLTYSLIDSSADVYAEQINFMADGTTSFTLKTKEQSIDIRLPLLGEHNVSNALAVTAVALAFNLNIEQIKAGLEQSSAVQGRLTRQVLGQLTLIDDTYNANPGSVRAAIDVLASLEGSTTLILGHMAELGEESKLMHQEIGQYAIGKTIDRVIAVGEHADVVSSEHFDSMDTLLDYLEDNNLTGTVLIKGSRSAQMERVVAFLAEQHNNRRTGETH